jgi:para-nitrobenzyl esterase
MLTTGSVTHSWPGTMPADNDTCGPIMVPAPIRMKRSFTRATVGKQITLPVPNAPKRRPRRLSGPMAPSSTAASHAQRTASPPARFIAPRARSHGFGGPNSRRSMPGEDRPGLGIVRGVDVVATTTGRVAGRANGDVVAFKGIPYATAARWAPPQPVAGWTGVRDALEFGPQAPQTPGLLEAAFGMADWPMSEDCLSLNVWTRAPEAGARRPVLVFIHGGAFTNGTGAVPWYHGDAFVRDGCVLVTLNYRLGALGYLHLADVAGERFAGSGNLGLLDQVAALDWVQANIAAFGGDPANVTIFGESAGGASVLALLACPAADGRFRRAIAQSPSILQLRSRVQATAAAEHVLDRLGIERRQLDRLFDVPVPALLDAQASFVGPELFTAFAPTPDGAVLPGPVVEAAATATPRLLIGTNRDELYLFTALDGRSAGVDAAGLRKVARRIVGDGGDALIAAYAAARPGRVPGQLGASIAGDDAFWLPAIDLAEARRGPTWMYRFDWGTPVFGGVLGACHGVELPFVFETLDAARGFVGDDPALAQLASTVHQGWVRFATTGDPGWPAYDSRRRATMCFDVASTVVDDPDGELRTCWSRWTTDRAG